MEASGSKNDNEGKTAWLDNIKQPPHWTSEKPVASDDYISNIDRTLTVYPFLADLVKSSTNSEINDVFQMVGYKDLQDLNVHSVGLYLRELHLGQFIIRDCTLTDKQLLQLLRGISREGSHQGVWEISIGGRNCEVGLRSIEMLGQIVTAKAEFLEHQKRKESSRKPAVATLEEETEQQQALTGGQGSQRK